MGKHIPKYLKGHYDIYTMNSFKDVPGWINDAEKVYPEMVNKAQDGDHFVEIGTLLGQSTSLIVNSKQFSALSTYCACSWTLSDG